MSELSFVADASRCIRCGACVKDCPSQIIKRSPGSVPRIDEADEPACIKCQHCLTICPSAAISILGLKPENSVKLGPGSFPELEKMELLFKGRRSVRQYSPKPVDATIVARLLKDSGYAASGCNARATTFTLVNGRDAMEKLLEKIFAAIEKADKAKRIPERLAFLKDAANAFHKEGSDIIFRGAPHLLIASAPGNAPCKSEDPVIALANFELLATTAGLGAVWCGFLKIILTFIPGLKEEFGLAKDCGFYPMLFGWPLAKYARTVQRDSAAPVKILKP